MKIIAGILYHIFARLCPQIALLTLKFWDQFSCRLYRNHRCCGTGGKAASLDSARDRQDRPLGVETPRP
jgi:hypothetical protein